MPQQDGAVEPEARLALRARGLLRDANRAGVLTAADVQVATTVSDVAGEDDPSATLALAVVVRAVRSGSVCLSAQDAVNLTTMLAEADADDVDSEAVQALHEAWPADAGQWLQAVRDSTLVRAGVLRVERDLIYLDRYHREEVEVARVLRERLAAIPPQVDEALLSAGLDRLFGAAGFAEQRQAADRAVRQWTTVLTGGPGTGKTTTVAGLLVLLAQQWEQAGHGRPLRVALAAPTGKAAARLQESVAAAADRIGGSDGRLLQGLEAMTLHRLLGNPRHQSNFRHDATNRLPHDVIVVDETSMVALSMMKRLLDAVRTGSRVIFVGDADQLASVDAGAVLADLVAGYHAVAPVTVCRLQTSHRFDEQIGAFAAAVRDGREDDAVDLLRAGHEAVAWVQDDDPTPVLRPSLVRHALRLREAAVDGDVEAALDTLAGHRLLCARRTGPRGIRAWNLYVDQWLSEATGDPMWEPMYAGRPLLVTRNDYGLGVYNGDSGVVMGGEGTPTAQIATTAGPVAIAANRLADIETMHAMTIHKSQGSEARQVTVLLPEDEPPMLTRELLYTAVTRAQERVVVVGSEETVRRAVRARIRRASGLRQRLAPSPTDASLAD